MAAEGSCTLPALLSFTLFARRGEGGEHASPEICKSPLSLCLSFLESDSKEIMKGERAITAISEQTRCLFFSPSFLSSTRGFRPDVTPSTCHCCNSCRSTWAVILKTVYHNIPKQHMSTRAAWNIRFLNINAISSLRNSGFNCPSLQFYWLYG